MRESDIPAQPRRGKNQVAASVETAIQQIEAGLKQLYAATSVKPPAGRGSLPLNEHVRALIELRRLRFDIFPPMLFSDPAWDMLLELYSCHLEHRRLNISRLTAALPVAATTTLRWIERLESDALIVRRNDPRHARRIWIELSQYGQSLMDRYFQQSRGYDPKTLRQLFEPR